MDLEQAKGHLDARRSPKVGQAVPLLYLHGLPTNDFVPALACRREESGRNRWKRRGAPTP